MGSPFQLPRQLGMAIWASFHRRSVRESMGWHFWSFKTKSERCSVSLPSSELVQGQQRWGPSPGYPEGSGKKKSLSLNDPLGPHRRRPSSSPREDSVFSEPWKCSQLQQPDCGPEHTAPCVATGTHSLWMTTSAEGISKVFDNKMLQAERLLKDRLWKSRG